MFNTCMKDTFRFFVTHWWMLALIIVPINLMGELIRAMTSPVTSDPMASSGVAIYVVVAGAVSLLVSIASIEYMGAVVSSSSLSVTKAWAIAGSKLLGYLFLVGLSVLAVIAGLLVFIIPGIVIMVRISLAPYLFLLEHQSAKEAIKESWKLTAGHFGDLFFGTILFMIPGLVFSFIVAGSIEIMDSSIEAALVSSIEMVLAAPITVFYYRVFTYLKQG